VGRRPSTELTILLKENPEEAKALIERVLYKAGGDVKEAAKRMAMGSRTLWKVLYRLDIQDMPMIIKRKIRLRFRIL